MTCSVAHFLVIALAALTPLAGCSDACPSLEICDIRHGSCQGQVAHVVACLRGGDETLPEVEVVDAATFVQGEIDNNDETDDARDFRLALALFDLAAAERQPSESVTNYWDTIAAFYSRQTDKVTILDRGAEMDSSSMVTLLAHEFVHAMQHHDLGDDLYATHDNTLDERLALSAMLEGEATLYQDLATVRGFGLDDDDVEWNDVFSAYQADRRQQLRDDGEKYQLASRRFVYAFGGGYVNQAWQRGGNNAVRDIFDDLPASTREVIVGYGNGAFSQADNPDDVGLPVLGDSYELIATRRLGAWLFDAFRATSTSSATPATQQPADVFTGDVFSAWRDKATNEVMAVWRLRFVNDDEADQFALSLRIKAGAQVARSTRDVMVVASTEDTLPTGLVDTLQWGQAPETDWAAPTDENTAFNIIECERRDP